MTRGTLDRRAAVFDRVAEEYERGRPGYPDAAVDWAVAELGLDAGAAVLDLAAGTGKLTVLLAARFATVHAVEPLRRMRAILRRRCPEARVHDGLAESIPLPDASVDAVTVGEAFHWFCTRAAVREIRRVLRPGGGVALLWNCLDRDGRDVPWLAELDRVLEAHKDPSHGTKRRYYSGAWRRVIAESGLFGPIRSAEFPNPHRLTTAAQLDRAVSWSAIAALPPVRRRAARDAVAAVLGRHGTSDAVLAYRTDVHCAAVAIKP